MHKQKGMSEVGFFGLIAAAVVVGIIALMLILPPYNAWRMEMKGEGLLRLANLERQALVAQAQAERDSAELRAEAIEIVGKAAQEFPEYRQQEFIGAFASCLEKGCAEQIIYVPTEANIPITEAGKR